jgi:hypothetical protein
MEGQPESALVMILANPKVSPIYRGLFKHPSGIQIAAHSRAFDTHGMSTLSRAELADDFNAIIQDIVGDINAIIFRTSAFCACVCTCMRVCFTVQVLQLRNGLDLF